MLPPSNVPETEHPPSCKTFHLLLPATAMLTLLLMSILATLSALTHEGLTWIL